LPCDSIAARAHNQELAGFTGQIGRLACQFSPNSR
jgi:hypothetical protein